VEIIIAGLHRVIDHIHRAVHPASPSVHYGYLVVHAAAAATATHGVMRRGDHDGSRTSLNGHYELNGFIILAAVNG